MELRELLQELLLEAQRINPEEEIMTISETAQFLKISVPTVRNMISDKEIPFFQRGQVIRLSRSDVREWLRHNSKY
jgi:excisionase family DNA binding protein